MATSNNTSLYSSTSSNAVVNSRNYTTLYSASTGTVSAQTPYGNANVAGFLAEGSDTGGNSIGNITAAGIISAQGNIVTDANFIGTFIGNISGNIAAAGANTQVQYNNSGALGASSAFTFNQASNVLSIGGNVSANYFLGNGSQLTGLPVSYGNANVAAFLPTYTGNLSGGNLALTGNAAITGGLTTSNNIVSGANIQAAGNIRTTGPSGNITGVNYASANFFVGNGSLLTGVVATSTYGNANVVANLAALGSNPVSTTGNISAGYFLGNGSQLTGLAATYSNANVASFMAAFGSNTITTTGNIVAGNVNLPATGTFFVGVAGLNSVIIQPADISVVSGTGTGRVSADYFLGNGSNLSGITGANVSGTVANATYATSAGTATSATTAGTVTTNAQPNITSVGILTSLSSSGNITGSYFLGNGSQLTGLPATYSNANVASFMANFGSNSISTSGNVTASYHIGNGSLLSSITGGNVSGTVANATYATTAGSATTATTAGTVTSNAQANITSVGTLTSLAVTGNIDSGNLRTTGLISATGNITGNFFVGNGSQLTGIVSSYGNANVVANLAALGSNPVSTTGNITGGNINATVVSATGNVQAGNLRTTGLISASGNVTGNFFVGNGSALTGIVSSYGNANVVANLAALGSNPVSTTGNITANYFIGNGSALTGITSSYGNANVATFMAAFGSNTITTTGNIVAGNVLLGPIGIVSTNGNVTAGNLTVNGLINTSGSLSLTGNISASGNVTAGNVLLGPIGIVSTNGNVTAGNLTVNGLINTSGSLSLTGNISASGNVTGNYYIGNGSLLSSITGANVSGTVANATYATTAGSATTATSATTAGTVTGNAQANITSVGTLTSLAVTGNASAGNITTAGLISATGNITGNFFVGNGSALTGITSSYGNANVVANLAALGSNPVSTTGNVTAGYFAGNGSLLTSITGANVTGTVANATTATTAGTVTTAAQANITSVGTLTSLAVTGNASAGNITTVGLISATGNVSGNFFIGNGSLLTGISAGGTYGNANVVANLAALGSNPVSTTGNVTAGTGIFGAVSVSGNISGNSSSNGVKVVNYKDNVYALTYASTITPDPANGSIQQVTLTGNVTWSAFGGTPQAGQSMVVSLTQDATGNRLLTSTMKFAGGSKVLSTAANSVDIVSVFYDGTNYYASLTLAYS